ncbi:Gustatory receptor for sugar taste 64f [Frankliniella fusca]|uniref:Gustatory receptor n=1 Tax=Frankliniella fusca TaxID=407009 RepID=A0AAE1H772_9NEOP|nr:Gustatory receptor for sugar taste 64f [Frankliniella fusca]
MLPSRKTAKAAAAAAPQQGSTVTQPRLLLSSGKLNAAAAAAWSEAASSTDDGGPRKEGGDTFLHGLRPAATLAQVFGLLPVKQPSDETASFRWASVRVAYSVLVILASAVQSVFSLMRMLEQGVNFHTSVNVVFFTTSTITSLLFLRMATSWGSTFSMWSTLERFVAAVNGHPARLVFRMKVMTVVALLLAAVEHSLSIAATLAHALPCYDRGGLPLLMEGYFMRKYRKTFTIVSYSPWRALLIFILQIITTFNWNFSDLFVVLVSMGLAAHFRQLNVALDEAKGKLRHEVYWRSRRESYNALAVLTRAINDYVGPVVLASYASNLYFTCLQLLIVSKRKAQHSHLHNFYFFFSLVFLIVRTVVISLLAADVYLESQRPRPVLFSVPSPSFCREVQRFLMQVNTDSVALTGCDFFSVTRSFMLTVAGTIVTYIVILVQFDTNATGDDSGPQQPNRTLVCTCSDLQIYNC